MWVLCLSDKCCHLLNERYPQVRAIQLEELEATFPDLAQAKANRSQVEYYFTLTPHLPLYILQKNESVDMITYLDSDLYFFSDPEPVFQEISQASTAIISHRFPDSHNELEKYGVFNVGWMSFRRDTNGLACLRWYRDQCCAWCYDRIQGDRYADQKYLNKFQELFEGVHVVRHKGANLAPWNIANYTITEKNGQVLVDDEPLIFFHFQGMERLNSWVLDSGFMAYDARMTSVIRHKVFLPYLEHRALHAAPAPPNDAVAIRRAGTRFVLFQKHFPRLFEGLRKYKRLARIFLTGTYILFKEPRT